MLMIVSQWRNFKTIYKERLFVIFFTYNFFILDLVWKIIKSTENNSVLYRISYLYYCRRNNSSNSLPCSKNSSYYKIELTDKCRLCSSFLARFKSKVAINLQPNITEKILKRNTFSRLIIYISLRTCFSCTNKNLTSADTISK